MSHKRIHVLLKILIGWYIIIFVSTEFLSLFQMIYRTNLLIVNICYFCLATVYFRKELKAFLPSLKVFIKSNLIICIILLLTLIQGVGSSPSTTDAMVYHIPRVMRWFNNHTTSQSIIINPHDFMPPFPEKILLHLYSITNSDNLLFLSQWFAFIASIFLCGEIFLKLGGDKKIKSRLILFCGLIPIALFEATSTQTDMVTNLFVMLALYFSLILIELRSLPYAVLLGLALGLGMLTKPTFLIFSIIPAGILFFFLIQKDFRKIPLIIITGFIALILQFGYFSQNIKLYGTPLGQSLFGSENGYINEVIDPKLTLSNMLRNTFINLPLPVGTSLAEKALLDIHHLMALDINDPRATYFDLKFHIASVLYPQEDIVGNPLHLVLIFLAGLGLILKWKNIRSSLTKFIFIFLFISFTLFSLLLKWQPFNVRLETPFFMIGSVISFLILGSDKIGKKILSALLLLSVPLAFILILLNVSRPYISYSFFYNSVKEYAPLLSDVPEAFYIRSRQRQYFNARPYWFDPYYKIADLLSEKKEEYYIKLRFMDEFEYPIWALLKDRKVKFKVVYDNSKTMEGALLFTTSKVPIQKRGYESRCFKTNIDYGFACLSKPI